MVDIHAHILPFVDDGSSSLEVSIELIREAMDCGVKNQFLTPHFMKTRNFLSVAEENQKVFQSFKETIKQRGWDINLYLGNEIYYSIDVLESLRKKHILPLGNSNKVLIEFSLSEMLEDMPEAVHNISSLGYVPVIAHVERYSYLNRLDDIKILRRMGAMIQVNASSIVGLSGKTQQAKAMKMIKLNDVDFVASDVHASRLNHMKQAYALVLKKFGRDMAEKIFNNQSVL
ncbi:MAG: CpsB/CapC family capsule biosynthesis tyrosine phosphatase [Candidatus Izemoplasmatales bacterium]|jgi:protein-tyrosine phosphatase